MTRFDWHSEKISRATSVDATYKSTQNVRRFMREQCGSEFKFDRQFMAWIKSGAPKTMGDVVDEWKRRNEMSGGT
ncbi:MAG: DUF6434 domain-containing protein [Pseudomonadota bacterium]